MNSTLALVATAAGVAFLSTVSISLLLFHPAEATAGVGSPGRRRRIGPHISEKEERALVWLGFEAGVGMAAIGLVGDAHGLLIAGALLAAGTLAVLMPEVVFVGFLVAGGVKAAPWLSGVPVDLTLVFWLGTVLAMVLRAIRSGIPKPPTGMAIAVPLVTLVVASVLWSLDADVGLSKAVRFEILTMTALVAPIVLIRSRAELLRAACAFCGFGLLVALTTVRTGNLGEPLAAAGGNEIEAALYPAVGLLCVLSYIVLVTRGWARWIAVATLAILVPAVIAPGSRGVLVATGLALVYFVVVGFIRSRHRLLIVSAVGVIALAGVLLWPVLAAGATSRYEDQLFSTDTSAVLGKRGQIYDRAIGAALTHPIGGLGVGGYTRATVVDDDLYPHNIIIEFAAEEGLVAAALFIALVVAAWMARRRVSSPIATPEVLLSGSLLVFLLLESMVSFDINSNRLLWFALGLAFALPRLRVD